MHMSQSRDVVIIGAGGFGLEALQYARDAHVQGWPYRVTGFIDDEMQAGIEIEDGVRVMGTTDDEVLMAGQVIIAVGDPSVREALAAQVHGSGGRLVTLVHPSAYVAPSARLGAGSLLCPFSMVGVRAVVGQNVAMNVFASVGHEASVGNHTVLSPYSAMLGRTCIGARCYLATQATVAPGITIGSQSKVSAGSVVMRDAAPGSMLAGNPAKGRVMFRVEGATGQSAQSEDHE